MPTRSFKSGVAAVRDAGGGTLCIDLRRLPADFDAAAVALRATDVQLVICSDLSRTMHPFLIRPVPIRVRPLTARASELPRIVDAYARDAIEALGADDDAGFTAADRTWVLDHAARTLPAIETATLRRVALRQAGTVNGAARRLGMSPATLSQWLGRRRAGGRRRTGGAS
jgi:DNA-binding NtrC family response regulator